MAWIVYSAVVFLSPNCPPVLVKMGRLGLPVKRGKVFVLNRIKSIYVSVMKSVSGAAEYLTKFEENLLVSSFTEDKNLISWSTAFPPAQFFWNLIKYCCFILLCIQLNRNHIETVLFLIFKNEFISKITNGVLQMIRMPHTAAC